MKAHPKAHLDIISDGEMVDNMDQNRLESIRAQKKMRERIQQEQKEKEKN